MPSNTRNMFLLITLVFGGSLIFFGIVPENLLPLQWENESSKILHPKFNAHAKKLLASNGEKWESLVDYTTHSATINSMLPSDSLKTDSGVGKALLNVKSFRGRFRRHSRKKRNTKDRFLPWKFNLNVSRLHTQNTESQSKERITSPELRMEKPGKHLDIALHVKGNDLDDSYSEMHHAWDSVENFLRQLFGGNIEELSEKGHGVFVDLNGLPSKVHDGDRMKSFVNEEARNQDKDKEGKLLFGLFGQGGNSENPPMDQGNQEVLENIPTTKSPLVLGAPADDLNPATTSEILDNVTHVHQSKESVAAEESKVQDIASKEQFTTEELKTLSTHLTESNNPDSLLAPTLTHKNDLSVTKLDDAEISKVATQNKSITESTINEDDFIEFCIGLLNRIKKSPRLLEEFNDLEGSGNAGLEENGTTSVEATSHGQTLTESISQQEQQNMGFFASLLNRITGGRTWQEQSSASTEQSNMIENGNRKAKTININNNNLFINFGSGISTELDGFENMKFDEIDLNTTQNTENGVFTASDCKVFFRHIRSTYFPTESNVLKSSTQIESIPNLKEDLSLDEKSTSFTTENLQDKNGDRSFNGLLGSGDVINLKLENTEDKYLTVSTIKNLETIAGLSDDKGDRIFNVLRVDNSLKVGSGTSKLPAKRKDLVLRTFLNVKNGGRGKNENFLNDQSTENPLIFTTASPDLRIFPGFFNFGSGESNFGEFSQFETSNPPDVAIDKDERTFGGLLGFGNGGRQIQEKIESQSSDFTTNNMLNFEDVNVRKLSIEERYKETNLGSKSYERDPELVAPVDMLQARRAKEDFKTNSDVLERQDALISAKETDKQNRRFIRFQSVGSGDGRDLEENENSVFINEKNSGCSVICTIESGVDSFIKCTECPLEFSTDIPLEAIIETHYDSADSEIALGLTSSTVEYTDTKPINSPKSYQTDESSKRDLEDNTASHDFSNPIGGTIIPTSKIGTKTKESTLTGKIFLTINGENGPINLVQDTELTSPSSRSLSPRFAARKGRLIDESLDSEDDSLEPEDFENSSQELRTHDNSTKPFFEDIVQAFKQTEGSKGEFIASLLPLPLNRGSSEHTTTNSPALITELTGSYIQRRFGSEPRSCNSHDQCDKSLNEQCTSKTSMGICDCGLYFVRHSVTGKCEEPFRLKTQLRLPREAFRKALKDESSNYFHKKRKDSVITMRLLIGQDSYLKDTLASVEVDGFEEGSLVVNYDLTFAKEQNKSLVEFILRVNTVVTEALKNENMIEKTPLNIANAQLVSMGTFAHRCDAKELNYCSVNAKCIPVDDKFECKCNEGYLDSSREGYAGEVCEEYCPPDYCGNNGYCDINLEDEKICLCRDWYFGERCQIPGLLLIAGILAFNIAVVLIILGIICICGKMRYRKTLCYGSAIPAVNANGSFGRLTHVSPRLQDTVALNQMELGGATKYVPKSTPKQRIPDIDVSSPSIGESSNSYDFDSTFDRSASIEDQNKTVVL